MTLQVQNRSFAVLKNVRPELQIVYSIKDLMACTIPDSPKGKGSLRPRYDGDGEFICVYFGRLVNFPTYTLSRRD